MRAKPKYPIFQILEFLCHFRLKPCNIPLLFRNLLIQRCWHCGVEPAKERYDIRIVDCMFVVHL